MQIPMGDSRRVDFYGNAKDGVYIQMVDERGITYCSRRLFEEERMTLIHQLSRKDDGRAV